MLVRREEWRRGWGKEREGGRDFERRGKSGYEEIKGWESNGIG